MADYVSAYTGSQVDQAVAKALGLPASVAELNSDSVVTPGQARAIVQTKTGSFTLGAADAEKFTLLQHGTVPIVVTLPLDSTYNFPIGTAFNFVQWGAAGCSFAVQSGVSWKTTNNITTLTGYGAAATFVKVAANTWWGVCG